MDPFLGSLFSTLVSPLASLMNHITEHATYPFKVGDNVRDLESTTRNLEARMKDINDRIDSDERQALTTTHQVKEWLQKVKDIIAETNVIKEKYYNRSCKCAGRSTLNCCSNYSIGKRAVKKLLEVQKLYDDGVFESVAVKLPPPLIKEMPTTSNASSKSSQVDSNLQKALDYLHNDTVTMIGIWGMGGVGKTHLLNQIKDSFYFGHSIFDAVIFVTASTECSVKKVQDEIINKFRLKCNDEEPKDTISYFLTTKSFLLLVDDLWGRLDLEAVGIPTPLTAVDRNKRKMVLTTRSDEVCAAMRVERQIKVDRLDDVAAWSLFQENVGEETLSSDPFIPTLAKEIVKELGGLPLALITIGRAMHPKKNNRAWEYVVDQLKESRLHEIERETYQEEDTTIFHKLKFSYEKLKSDTLKQCFLSCSMWPKDYEISKEELIRCWIALGLVEVRSTLRSTYNRGYTLIEHLRAACLLESTGYDRESVKMQDVIRDMALWIARDYGENNNKWIVKAKVGQVVQTLSDICEKTVRISLMMNSLLSLPFPNSIHPSNRLTSLFLQINSLPETTLGLIQIFQSLTYLDLYENNIHEFPVEIRHLVKLQYLNLGGNSFPSLPEELNSLINLKYLYLRDNKISTISKGVVSGLKALQVLDLFQTSLVRPSADVTTFTLLLDELRSLNKLMALGITAVGRSQLQRLENSTNLRIQSVRVHALKEPILSLTTNSLGKLNHFEISESDTKQISIISSGQNAEPHLDIETLRFYDMKYWDGVIEGASRNSVFQLRRLEFTMCPMLKNVSCMGLLPCLQELKITSCKHLKYVTEVQEVEVALTLTFRCLEIMELFELPELYAICDPGVTFPSLRYLKLDECHELKKLPFQLHTIPSKLEKIECQKSTWDAFELDDNLRDTLEKVCYFLT